MESEKSSNNIIIIKPSPDLEQKYCKELSHLILKNFGRPYYPENKVKEILSYSLKFYVRKFKSLIDQTKYYEFYRQVFLLNEMAASFKMGSKNSDFNEEINTEYLAKYRRILKMILEQACSLQLHKSTLPNKEFKPILFTTISELLILGEKIYDCSASYAEHSLIEDPNNISFDENDLYILSRRHHYEDGFRKIVNMEQWGVNNWVIDPNGEMDFDKILNKVFGFSYGKFNELIIKLFIYNNWRVRDIAIFQKEHFINICVEYLKTTKEIAKQFIEGLVLTNKNKLSIQMLATHPHTYDRMLHRPFLEWNIDGQEYYLFGRFSLFEAISSIQFNAIPWEKAPSEWLVNKDFKNYVITKKELHDKWLDDAVENKIKMTDCLYEKSVKTIKTKEKYIRLDNKVCGEIDFIVINKKTKIIFLLECKHLIARSDMANWKQDLASFTTNKKAYNKTLQKKINWAKHNLAELESHFQHKERDCNLSLLNYKVKGVFVINTPTFYMYNSDLRIYVYHDIDKVLTGEYHDKIYSLYSIGEKVDSHILIKFPYFKRNSN